MAVARAQADTVNAAAEGGGGDGRAKRYEGLAAVRLQSVVVDVREAEEIRESGAVAGAAHVPLGHLEAALSPLPPPPDGDAATAGSDGGDAGDTRPDVVRLPLWLGGGAGGPDGSAALAAARGTTRLVFYCRSGRRSAKAMHIAARHGFASAHFPGGFPEYAAAGVAPQEGGLSSL